MGRSTVGRVRRGSVVVVAALIGGGAVHLWTRRVEGELLAPVGEIDRDSSSVAVLVHSPVCSSAFDGDVDFEVVESESQVVVTASLRPPLVIFGCDFAYEVVERTVMLERPLGTRRLLDGSKSPPVVVSTVPP